MKLISKPYYSGDSSGYCVVEAAREMQTPLMYAARIEEDLTFSVDTIDRILVLAANLIGEKPYKDFCFYRPFKKYSDEEILEEIRELFVYEKGEDNTITLFDEDYLNIYNSYAPFKYDRCTVLNTDYITKYIASDGHGRDFSWWTEYYNYSYKVLVKKGVALNEDKKYTLEEIAELQKSGDIVIIQAHVEEVKGRDHEKDQEKALEYSKKDIDLMREEWLEKIVYPKHPHYADYVTYVKGLITPEFIRDCVQAYVKSCLMVCKRPSQKAIRRCIDPYEFDRDLVLEMKTIKEMVEYVNQYIKENDLINIAQGAITHYSRVYKHLQSLKKACF